MITVISGTNRPGSRTLLFATQYLGRLEQLGVEAQLLDLADIPPHLFAEDMYNPETMTDALKQLQNRFILGVEKMVIFVPEYNGSYPGILKLFIDRISVNEYARNFSGKHVALVGVASGRAGNLRGMDHLCAAINHMGGWVLPNKLPLSNIASLVDEAGGEISDPDTIAALDEHARQLIAA